MTSYAIATTSLIDQLTDEKLLALSSENPDMRFERNAEGKLIIMPPTGTLTGQKNGDLFFQIELWNRQDRLGKVFDSSTGFRLSNNSVRSPDVSWMSLSKWNSLSDKQKRGYAPIAPDFVLELMSPTDDLTTVQQKMAEYMTCDIKLGWLINPDEKQVEIYRIGQDKEILNNPSSLSGEDIMPNLVVDLADIWQ